MNIDVNYRKREPARLLLEAKDDDNKFKPEAVVKKSNEDIVVESKDNDPEHGFRKTLIIYSGPTSMDRLQVSVKWKL
jgi:hypothetical protein